MWVPTRTRPGTRDSYRDDHDHDDATGGRLRRHQAEPAHRMGIRRLLRHRHHPATDRRTPLRGRRHLRPRPRARRRRRKRQRLPGGRPARRAGDRRRLRGPSTRRRVDPCQGGAAVPGGPGGRCRGAALRRRLLRCRPVRVRRHVHPRPAPRGRRARPSLPAEWTDRVHRLDARQFRRTDAPARRLLRHRTPTRRVAVGLGDG